MPDDARAPATDDQRSFAEELIRETGGGGPVEIRFFAEVGCDFALWDPDNAHLGELEDRLPMSPDLRARIKDWAVRGYRHDGGERRLSPVEFERFVDEGRALSERLQGELGPAFKVRYHP